MNEYGQRLITSQDIWGALEQYANGDPALAPFVPQIQAGQAAAPDYWDNIMSTGYTEQELFGNEANNLKGNAGIYFRPNNNTEISLSSLASLESSRGQIYDLPIDQRMMKAEMEHNTLLTSQERMRQMQQNKRDTYFNELNKGRIGNGVPPR